ncbi:MAG: DUF881 domain-containing protein [Chloroflexota bacterium]|nr:DUF881 domain-containing protein [Chloroflexota bacterium]
MRGRAAQYSLMLVAMVIGLLAVGQLRSQSRPAELTRLSAQELSTLIETLTQRNRELRTGLADIREQVREYTLLGSQGQSAIDVSREDLRRITAFAALAPVEGQGIVMIVDGDLDAIALNDLINELRNAGAEAIAVDDVRVTARSVAIQGALSLQVDGVNIAKRFSLRAIGSPEGLLAAVERPGGIISQLKLFVSATIQVRQSESVQLPATAMSLAPTVGEVGE